MVQLEIEFIPTLVGFSLGTAACLIPRLFLTSRSSQPLLSAKAEQSAEQAAEASAAPTAEPHAEPCGEPQPEPAPVTAQDTCIRPRIWHVALVFAVAALASLVALPSQGPSAPPAPEEPAVAEPAAPAELLQLEQRPAAKAAGQAKTQHHITINLTRQSMASYTGGGGDHYRSAYWGTITVGSPAAAFKVALDTGSGHLILPSTYCHSETCRAHQRYRRRQSVTAKDIDYDGAPVTPGAPRDQITVSFGTGEVVGVFVEDVTCLDNDAGTLALRDSSIGRRQMCTPLRMIMATAMSDEPFGAFDFDGVLGLGLLGLSQAPEFNFLHLMASSMKELGSTTPHMFGVFLAKNEEDSEITIGGYDEHHMETELYWNPVVQPELGHWMVQIKSLRVDNMTVAFCSDGCKGVLDSGTSLLSVPTPVFPEIYELLRHEADPVHRCRGFGPKLHLELDNFTVTLEPSDFAQMEPPLPGVGGGFGSFEQKPEMCKPMLMSMEFPAPLGPKLFVLGEPVLRRYYSVFDSDPEAPRIGFSSAFHGIKEDDWADEDDELP